MAIRTPKPKANDLKQKMASPDATVSGVDGGDSTYAPDTSEASPKELQDVAKYRAMAEAGKFDDLIEQIKSEHAIAYQFIEPKRQVWRDRLRLYNNQRRDPDATGDTTLFSTMQTVLAAMYDGGLTVDFGGRSEGSRDVANNLRDLALFDAELMAKEELDYDSYFDACFFGFSLILMDEFDRDEQCIYPEVINPLTWMRDPKARSVNGDPLRGRGAMRFGGRDISLTKDEMAESPFFFNTGLIKTKFDLLSDEDKAQRAQDDAQGRQVQSTEEMENSLHENTQYEHVQWFTNYRLEGKVRKVKVWLANNLSLITRFQVVDEEPDARWPIVHRKLYPTPRDFESVSVPDLVEDKQRARAVVYNLLRKSMESELYGMYVFDKNRISANQNFDFALNKFIPSDGNTAGAISPLLTKTPNYPLANFILDSLDGEGQRATATPDIQKGQIASQPHTLGEVNLAVAKVNTRYTLTLKVFGWSEKEFWRMWYGGYKKYFADKIAEKIISIDGIQGSQWRPLTRDQIIAEIDPVIKIESKIVAEFNKATIEARFNKFATFIQSDPNSGADRQYLNRMYAEIIDIDKEQIDRLLPPTAEYAIAQSENEMINANKLPPIHNEDDHITHLWVHNSASQNAVARVHIKAHQKALLIQRENSIKNSGVALNSDGSLPTDPTATNPAGTPGVVINNSPNISPTISPDISGGGGGSSASSSPGIPSSTRGLKPGSGLI